MKEDSGVFQRLIKPQAFKISLLVLFIIIFGIALTVARGDYRKAIKYAHNFNKIRANQLESILLEHQRAAIGVLQAYGEHLPLINAIKKKDLRVVIENLSHLKENNPEIDQAFIVDPDGTLWANFPFLKESLGKNFSHADWYVGVKNGWRPYVSNIFKKMNGDNDLGVVVCSPIFDEQKKEIGILGTFQRVQFLRKLIDEVALDPDQKITLVDQRGRVICSNKNRSKSEIMGCPLFQVINKKLDGRAGDVEIQDSSDGNKTKYVSFIPIEKIGWDVIVEKGKEEVFKEEFENFAQIAGFSLLMFSLGTLGLVYLRKKYKQMEELRESQKRLQYLSSQLINAQETERKRIAEDLHDSICASLSAIKFGLERNMAQMKRDSPEMNGLKEIIAHVSGSIDETRRIMSNLRPSVLDDLGLLPTINWFCREFQKTYPAIRMQDEMRLSEDEVPEPLKIVIYRVMQEALNNVVKHSRADLVRLCLRKSDTAIEWIIQDNGTGFVSKDAVSRKNIRVGFGLTSMKERVEFSGGAFEIESSKGAGTTLRAVWPRGSIRTR